MDLNRRQFLKTLSTAAAMGFSPRVSKGIQRTISEAEIKSLTTALTPELMKFTGLTVLEHIGQPKDFDEDDFRIRLIERDLSEGFYDRTDKEAHYFLGEPGSKHRKFIEHRINPPVNSELKDYETLKRKLSAFSGLDILYNGYERLHEAIMRGGMTNAIRNPILHPATVISGRLGENFCMERAFAFYDLFNSFGLKIKFPIGQRTADSAKHVWNRIYAGDDYVEVDVGRYSNPTFFRRRDALIYKDVKIE